MICAVPFKVILVYHPVAVVLKMAVIKNPQQITPALAETLVPIDAHRQDQHEAKIKPDITGDNTPEHYVQYNIIQTQTKAGC